MLNYSKESLSVLYSNINIFYDRKISSVMTSRFLMTGRVLPVITSTFLMTGRVLPVITCTFLMTGRVLPVITSTFLMTGRVLPVHTYYDAYDDTNKTLLKDIDINKIFVQNYNAATADVTINTLKPMGNHRRLSKHCYTICFVKKGVTCLTPSLTPFRLLPCWHGCILRKTRP